MSITAAWGALYFTTATPVPTSAYGTLNFAMQASTAGQRYAVILKGAGGVNVGQAIVLANVGGDPVVGSWKEYAIPLGATGFNTNGAAIIGVFIQDYTGGPQPAAYIDEIALR
jgi:hypothetical protein